MSSDPPTPQDISDMILERVREGVGIIKSDIITSVTNDLKRKIQDETSDQISKRRKLDEVPDFQRKGNKQQFLFNKDIIRGLDSALNSLAAGENEKATRQITEGKQLLEERQKHILIADREDDGWAVVNHYIKDSLANDSDDEKRIGKARREAAIDLKKAKDIRNKKFKNKRRFSDSFNNRSGFRFNQPHTNEQRRDERICYACGVEGHLQYDCPRRQYQRRDFKN